MHEIFKKLSNRMVAAHMQDEALMLVATAEMTQKRILWTR